MDKSCIWMDKSNCINCTLNQKLHCHPRMRISIYFLSSFLFFLISAIIGLFLANYEILIFIVIILVWIIYMIFFFNIWESKVLCSHCPYYENKDQRILHCYANAGILKTSKYKPGPISKSEKIQFILGVVILIGYPLPFLLFREQYIALIFSLLGIIIWIFLMQTKICTICINFSCPLNRVKIEYRDCFIKKNPIIKIAWEEKGYVFND